MTQATIRTLYRYPVKGLSPEPLARAELSAGQYFPGDRLYAIENGPPASIRRRPCTSPRSSS